MWILLSIEPAPDSSDVHLGSTYLIDDLQLSSPTGVRTEENSPVAFALGQNYPNPFNPSTTIPFDLPERSSVRLTVLNVLGQEVGDIFSGEVAAGRSSVTWSATVPSGVYFYRIEAHPIGAHAGTASQVRRMIILK